MTLSQNLVFATGGSALFANSNGNTIEPLDVVPNVITSNIFVCAHVRAKDDDTALKIRSLTPTHFLSNIIYGYAPKNDTVSMQAVQINAMPQWYSVHRWENNTYYNAGRGAADFGASWPGNRNWTAWQASGHDVHSQIADPLFYNPAEGDFRIPTGSPALDLGFRPFDTSLAGVRLENLYWWILDAGAERSPH